MKSSGYRSAMSFAGAAVLLWVVLLGSVVSGCGSDVEPSTPGALSARLPFLEDGRTTRPDILARMGAPDEQYEEDRIAVYELAETLDGQLTRVGLKQNSASFDLVLVFGPDGVLERHSVVKVDTLKMR